MVFLSVPHGLPSVNQIPSPLIRTLRGNVGPKETLKQELPIRHVLGTKVREKIRGNDYPPVRLTPDSRLSATVSRISGGQRGGDYGGKVIVAPWSDSSRRDALPENRLTWAVQTSLGGAVPTDMIPTASYNPPSFRCDHWSPRNCLSAITYRQFFKESLLRTICAPLHGS